MDFFLATNETMSQDQAREKATKWTLAGWALYYCSEDSFKILLGPEGEGIYEILVNGEYGHVS